jgi:hypothetical protein
VRTRLERQSVEIGLRVRQDHDHGTARGKQAGAGPADPLAGTGGDGAPAGELHHE